MFTGGESGEVRRLGNSSRAGIAPCDVRGRVRGGWRDATARVVSNASSVERARAALRAKYGWQM